MRGTWEVRAGSLGSIRGALSIPYGDPRRGFLQVFLDGQTAGFTEGGATITIEKETTPIQVDDFGSTPVDVVVQGTGATVEINFAQIEPEVISLVVPEGTLTASGTFEVGGTAGTSLLGLAKTLVLSGTNGTTSQQWTFHKAFVEAGTEIPYNREDQSVLTVPFRAVSDPDRLNDPDALFKYETFSS